MLFWVLEIFVFIEVYDVYLNYLLVDNDIFREDYVYI